MSGFCFFFFFLPLFSMETARLSLHREIFIAQEYRRRSSSA